MYTRRGILIATLLCICSLLVSEETVHTVKSGDTLYGIARRYSVSVDAISEWNEISDPSRLRIGQELLIPNTYTVQAGEYAYGIARSLGVDWRELLDVNGLTEESILRPGDVLLVPSDYGTDGNTAAAGEAPTAREQDEQAANVAEAAVGTQTPETASAEAGATVAGGDEPGASTQDSYEWPHGGPREVRSGTLYPGVSFVAEQGDPIYSVSAGTVYLVVPHSSLAVVVMVQSENGYVYVYGGNGDVEVQPGDRVSVGSVIGRVGYSSAFQSPRAFLAVYRDFRYIDPISAPRG